MKIIQFILEIFGWLFIVFGTTAASALIGFLIYIKWETGIGKMLSLLIISIGFIIGAVWATRIWRKYGTVEWLSGISRIT